MIDFDDRERCWSVNVRISNLLVLGKRHKLDDINYYDFNDIKKKTKKIENDELIKDLKQNKIDYNSLEEKKCY